MNNKEKEEMEKLVKHSKTMFKDGRSYGFGLTLLSLLLGGFYLYFFFFR